MTFNGRRYCDEVRSPPLHAAEFRLFFNLASRVPRCPDTRLSLGITYHFNRFHVRHLGYHGLVEQGFFYDARLAHEVAAVTFPEVAVIDLFVAAFLGADCGSYPVDWAAFPWSPSRRSPVKSTSALDW
jgi:hypothetical protein